MSLVLYLVPHDVGKTIPLGDVRITNLPKQNNFDNNFDFGAEIEVKVA